VYPQPVAEAQILMNADGVGNCGIDASHPAPDFQQVGCAGKHFGPAHGGVIAQQFGGNHKLRPVDGANDTDFIVVHDNALSDSRAIYGCSAAILCRLP